MSIRLLLNENFPRPALNVLRGAGVALQAVAELMPAASDREVLAYAAANGLWVVTFDRDYGELVFARKVAAPPAIVFLRQGAYGPVGRTRLTARACFYEMTEATVLAAGSDAIKSALLDRR